MLVTVSYVLLLMSILPLAQRAWVGGFRGQRFSSSSSSLSEPGSVEMPQE